MRSSTVFRGTRLARTVVRPRCSAPVKVVDIRRGCRYGRSTPCEPRQASPLGCRGAEHHLPGRIAAVVPLRIQTFLSPGATRIMVAVPAGPASGG